MDIVQELNNKIDNLWHEVRMLPDTTTVEELNRKEKSLEDNIAKIIKLANDFNAEEAMRNVDVLFTYPESVLAEPEEEWCADMATKYPLTESQIKEKEATQKHTQLIKEGYRPVYANEKIWWYKSKEDIKDIIKQVQTESYERTEQNISYRSMWRYLREWARTSHSYDFEDFCLYAKRLGVEEWFAYVNCSEVVSWCERLINRKRLGRDKR